MSELPRPVDISMAQRFGGASNGPFNARHRTPSKGDRGPAVNGITNGSDALEETGRTPIDPRHAALKDRYVATEARLLAWLGGNRSVSHSQSDVQAQEKASLDTTSSVMKTEPGPRKPARAIDEDDYGDDDDDESDEADANGAVDLHGDDKAGAVLTAGDRSKQDAEGLHATEKAEDDAHTLEEKVKKDFGNYFYTLEYDRDAMLEQKKLDDMDAQIEAETSGQPAVNNASVESLSNTNLGATSLVMKNLFRRIDEQRHKIRATDVEIRNIIRDVRKGRSKWASDDKVNQEELYEAAEQVINSLKADTDYAAPFLQRVNKREAPDYYQIIRTPMDISSIVKKLKNLQYKSKKEFVDDLNLIWANCLKYNADPTHFLRKKALYMRKKTEDLIQHVPDVVVRDRAEVEAEERRKAKLEVGADEEEDSDEEPIMASRGRKAPKKGSSSTRKAPPAPEGTAGAETKPELYTDTSATTLRNGFLRPDSEAPHEGSTNGLTTPPPGSVTPSAAMGVHGSAAAGSQIDPFEGDTTMLDDTHADDPDLEDTEFLIWRKATKKGRARVAKSLNRLFRDDKLNPDEPALLRSKAGMRKWMRQQYRLDDAGDGEQGAEADGMDGRAIPGTTIAEGMDEEEEGYLPDYYDTMSAIPELSEHLKWVEDAEGNVIMQDEETLRLVPTGHFQSPESTLGNKMNENIRQMQETRKICGKIGMVKQMQLQSQIYQNQFQTYHPTLLVEQDIEPHVKSDDGPVMNPQVCRAALQRSIAKIFYHAGFEDAQPSALEAVTDLTSDFFQSLVKNLKDDHESPKELDPVASRIQNQHVYHVKFTEEEQILHALWSKGQYVEDLDGYCTEDVGRLGTKLGVMHDRMKAHLAELLRPALDSNAGADGAGAFNDGSEQFIGGDFAEDINEDFFGFKELGLDKEFGLGSLSVPLHLLQNRMHSAYQSQNTSATSMSGLVMDTPTPLESVTIHSIQSEIGLVRDWFTQRLRNNRDEPLVEDEDLPIKQRYAKPRLPPTGKITSPRKPPIREQQQLAKKKRKLEEAGREGPNSAEKSLSKPLEKKLKLEMPSNRDGVAEPEKDDGSTMGMMSPPDSL